MSTLRMMGGLGFVLALASCGDRPSTANASHHAERLEPRFARLEQWALRALSSETVPSEQGVFEARLFAPLDGEPDVVDAWLARSGTAPGAYAAHGTPSPLADDRLTRVRLRDGNEVRVGFGTLDDPATRAVDAIDVVVLERTSRPSPTERVSFAVAFRRDGT